MVQIQNYINSIKSNVSKYNEIISPNDKKVIAENISRLSRIDELLNIDKYKLVFIGAPGTGKTTLICNYLSLLVDNYKGKEPNEIPLLNTASGKTTAAEVHILKGKRSLIRIEPCSQKEQSGYIRSYCRSLWDKVFDKEIGIDDEIKSGNDNTSAELDRMIRNMAGYANENEIKDEISQKYKPTEFNEFYNYIITKTDIVNRKVYSIMYDNKSDFKTWLKKTFSDINLGKSKGVAIPKRIYVQICQNDFDLPLPEWSDEIIDTRGFDGDGRIDVKSLIYQDDTINIVLDRISAPIDARLHSIFSTWVIKENTDIIPRLSLVIAYRNNELSSVCEAEDEEDGENIKLSEIDTCIRTNKLNYNNQNTIFYNAQGAYEIQNIPRRIGKQITNKSIITNIDSDNAEIYRNYFSEEITGIKDNFRKELFSEAEDLWQRTSNIFNSLEKQPTVYEIERKRVVSKLKELKGQASDMCVNNKHIINSFDDMFNIIKNSIHWASIRKTTEIYGIWDKCHIYALMESYLWIVVSQEITPYKAHLDALLASMSPQLSNYIKSYKNAEAKAYLKFKAEVEKIGYDRMFRTFNHSEDEPIYDFWNKAQNIHGKGYRNNITECYKKWIDVNGYDKGLCEAIRQIVEKYFDTVIDIIS